MTKTILVRSFVRRAYKRSGYMYSRHQYEAVMHVRRVDDRPASVGTVVEMVELCHNRATAEYYVNKVIPQRYKRS